MKMTNQEYGEYVKKHAPNSRLGRNLLRAFLSGGIVCCVGQAVLSALRGTGAREEVVLAATSILMVFLGAALTGLHIYDKLAKFSGAGTLVPITGFANAVAAPAMEFKSEGIVAGMAAKMFVIAGPVIVFGVAASVVFGLIYRLVR
jgi:stage V sporulation protein AC